MDKIFSAVIIIALMVSPILADGVSMNIPKDELRPSYKSAEVVRAIEYQSTSMQTSKSHSLALLDSILIEVMLAPGEYAAVFVDASSGSIEYEEPESPLDSVMRYWIGQAPLSMRRQLELNLGVLDSSYYTVYCEMLTDADPLWRDELFYCLGNLAHEILELPEMSYLLLENVEKIYAFDSLLSYVEIVDVGTPGTADHRTEAHYVTLDTGMTIFDTVVLDSEMYYKYVMFPKITDEIPGFIEPHTGDRIDPWYGCFWRTWFWSIEESIDTMEYWSLGDSLQMVSALWNGIFNDATDNGAVGVVTAWVQHSLEFTSDSERPHQPVRIYAKHMGRCGEHEDLTVAAARTALLPVRGIESISTDHVWNEFWTGWRWASLEPFHPYVDNQWVYVGPGWSKQFATVYEHTGKGRMVPVTERYSHEIAEINITATDASGRPLDGAEILIAAENGTSIYYDCILFTDSRGKAKAVVGDNKHMFYRVDSEIGSNPGPGYVDNLVTLTADGAVYNRTTNVPGELPNLNYTIDSLTETPIAYLGARIRPIGEFIEYIAPFDDMTATYFHWNDDAFGFSMFVLDEIQFSRFEAGSSFAVIAMQENCDFGSFELPVSNEPQWLILSNIENQKNILVGELAVMLHDSATSVEETKPDDYSISIYPNPFNSSVTVEALSNSEIEIYDLTGRRVVKLEQNQQKSADDDHPLRKSQWVPDESVASGVYLVRINAPSGKKQNSIVRRVVYLK